MYRTYVRIKFIQKSRDVIRFAIADTVLTSGETVGFTCTCDEGHTVNQVTGICDVTWCRDGITHCMNMGTCDDGGVDSTCVCAPGTTGTRCEDGTYYV